MKSDLRNHIESIIAAMVGLGYSISNDFFDFDSMPSSKMDKCFRMEVGTESIQELSGGRVDKKKRVDIWAAWKITAGGDRKEAVLDAIDGHEAIEDELMGTLEGIPGMATDGLLSKSFKEYLIIKAGFTFTYWRDLL